MTKNSKKTIALKLAGVALALGMGFALAPQALLAQQGPRPRAGGERECHGPGERRAHRERSPAERLAHFQEMLSRVSERLQLNARQNTAAQSILQDTLARIEQMRSSTAERTPERRAARHAVMEQAEARFSAILTPQQRTAFAALKVEFRERHGRGHRGGHGRDGDGRGERDSPGQRTEAQRGI